MAKIAINQYITADPKVCHGKPTVKGTRVMIWQILELLGAKKNPDEIYIAYPTLPRGAVEAALHYAAEKSKGISYVPFTRKERSQAPMFVG